MSDKKYTVKVTLTDNTTGKEYSSTDSTDELWKTEEVAASAAYHLAEGLMDSSDD
jgi:hypothetical protein